MRTSFHRQPEAQPPNFPAHPNWPAPIPHLPRPFAFVPNYDARRHGSERYEARTGERRKDGIFHRPGNQTRIKKLVCVSCDSLSR